MAPRTHAGHGVGRMAGIADRPGAGAARQRAQDDERGHEPPERELPELMLGRYRVLEERGKGGFGTVSVCWDPRLMRRVAIKVIPLHGPRKKGGEADEHADDLAYMDPQARAMEQAHSEIARRARPFRDAHSQHAAAPQRGLDARVRVRREQRLQSSWSTSRVQAWPSCSTQPRTACSPQTRRAASPTPWGEDALAFAHENGVLHLDIKPDNILVDASGRVRLADFGMAALSSITGFGGAAGGNRGLHAPRADPGRPGGRAHRRVCLRRRDVRGAHRRATLRGADGKAVPRAHLRPDRRPLRTQRRRLTPDGPTPFCPPWSPTRDEAHQRAGP